MYKTTALPLSYVPIHFILRRGAEGSSASPRLHRRGFVALGSANVPSGTLAITRLRPPGLPRFCPFDSHKGRESNPLTRLSRPRLRNRTQPQGPQPQHEYNIKTKHTGKRRALRVRLRLRDALVLTAKKRIARYFHVVNFLPSYELWEATTEVGDDISRSGLR